MTFSTTPSYMQRLAPTSLLPEISISTGENLSVRDTMQDEIKQLSTTISEIEDNFSKIARGVQNIDAMKAIWVAGKPKTYSSEWAELHDEFTTLVDISQLSASAVQSTIQGLLDTIKGHGENHKGLNDHLSTFIHDLEKFQDKATPIERRFLRLRQKVNKFRLDLKDDVTARVDLQVKPKVVEINRKIQDLQDQLSSASLSFVKSWEEIRKKKIGELQSGGNFLAIAGIAALAPEVASRYLRAHLISLGLSTEGARKKREDKSLKADIKTYRKTRKGLIQELHALQNVEEIIEDLQDTFNDIFSRLETMHGMWHMLRMDAQALRFQLSTSSDLGSESPEVRRVAISRFEKLYNTLWFALDQYTMKVATGNDSKADPAKAEPVPIKAPHSARDVGPKQFLNWILGPR